MKQLKKQLTFFYKSRLIFNTIIINNKYILILLLILMLITFIFNKNINSFKGLNIYEVNSLTIILYFVLFYLIYIKLNIMMRIISLFRSIKYFYYNIRLKIVKDIKIIALYYYIFNIFFIIISVLFINNLNNNLYIININNYVEYTNILTLILLLFYLKDIFNKEFKISDNNINPLFIILNIFILFIPFIMLNFYCDKINILDKYFIIHCDSKGSSSFESKIKENPSIVITNNSNSIINNPNSKIYINTPKDIPEDKPLILLVPLIQIKIPIRNW